MSLESSIATLTVAVQALMALPQTIFNNANAKIAELTATYNARLASLAVTLYVDPANGNDASPGTEALPLKTIAKAVALTPPGGRLYCRLMGPVTLTTDIAIEMDRKVHIVSSSATSHEVQFETSTYELGGTNYRSVAAFLLADDSTLSFRGLTLVVPTAQGAAIGYAESGRSSPIRARSDAVRAPGVKVAFSLCTLTIPTNNAYGPLITFVGPGILEVYGAVVTNNNLNGRLLGGVTNTSGTTANTLPWLLTNLLTV